MCNYYKQHMNFAYKKNINTRTKMYSVATCNVSFGERKWIRQTNCLPQMAYFNTNTDNMHKPQIQESILTMVALMFNYNNNKPCQCSKCQLNVLHIGWSQPAWNQAKPNEISSWMIVRTTWSSRREMAKQNAISATQRSTNCVRLS